VTLWAITRVVAGSIIGSSLPMRFLILCSLCVGASLSVFALERAMAQSETISPASPPELTAERAKAFLTAAGLQACEISEIDPLVSRIHGADRALSIGVAKDCTHYDPNNPTVVNVHQFADEERRDAMVASLQDLRFRALRPYGSVWAVENFVIILLGPQREEVETLIKAEYERRQAGGG
jgi:hypothetical protein